MSRHVIMFKGGVETQEFFSIEMARTFEANGYSVYWFDLVVSRQSTHLLRIFYEGHKEDEFIIFTFNFNGLAGEDGLYDPFMPEGSFWDYTGIPVYNMVVDHPFYYHKYEGYLPKNYHQISIDRNHLLYLNRFSPNLDTFGTKGFVPLGGTAINEKRDKYCEAACIPISDRKIDVIFTGNYTPVAKFERFIEHMDKEYQDLYKGLVNEAINNPDELIEKLAENRIRQELVGTGDLLDDVTLKEIMPNMMFVDLSVRFFYREKVIAAIADSGIKVHTYGAGWDMVSCRHPGNIIKCGPVNSQECLDMISQSKISVNVMPWFKDGAHDRIFNSMLNGAVCVSDKSRYLCEIFDGKDEIAFYDIKNYSKVGDIVKNLLDNPEKMQEMSDKAYNDCIINHTWKQRTQMIIDLIDNK